LSRDPFPFIVSLSFQRLRKHFSRFSFQVDVHESAEQEKINSVEKVPQQSDFPRRRLADLGLQPPWSASPDIRTAL
jgi:hypothetical protein